MNKIIFTFLFSFAVTTSFGQGELFEFNETFKEGTKVRFANITGSYVVLKVNGTLDELYQLTRDWINKTYSDPETVIISDTNSKFLKIQGSSENIFFSNAVIKTAYKNKYRLSFEFKENKIKVEINSLDVFEYIPKTYVTGKWKSKDVIVVSKKNGKPIKFNLQETERVKEYFNVLVSNLKKFTKSGGINNGDW